MREAVRDQPADPRPLSLAYPRPVFVRYAALAWLLLCLACSAPSRPALQRSSDPALPADRVTVRASCKKVRTSGKRRQSYYFRFAVREVLVGSWPRRKVQLEELYEGDGGSRLLARVHTFGSSYMGSSPCRGTVILRIVPRGTLRDPAAADLIWAGLPEETAAFSSLETTLFTLETALRKADRQMFDSVMDDPSSLGRGAFERASARASTSTTALGTLQLRGLRQSGPGEDPVHPKTPIGTDVWLHDHVYGLSLQLRQDARGWLVVSFGSDVAK